MMLIVFLATFTAGSLPGEPPGQEPEHALVGFKVDVSEAPEMKDWATKVVRVCTRAYPMICQELASPGFKPPQVIHLRITPRYRGVAATSGTHIIASARYFKTHPKDVGALVHETVHVVQQYRGRHNPGWLVEGVADYIRFFKYEPGKLGRINPRTARYNGSYRVTAAFLAYLTDKYDKHLVRKLNQAMRQGTYTDDLFKELTRKNLEELGEEWKASLQ